MNADQLEELESLGELQFSPVECAKILQVDEETIRQHIMAYERGRLKAIASVRSAMLQQAK